MIEYLVNGSGILLRRDAIRAGADDNALKRAVDSSFLVRMRQGVYVLAAVWESSDALERHRLLLEGVRMLYGDDVAASHISACVEQGGPTWGLDLSRVHLTHLWGKGERSVGKVVHHRGACIVGDVTRDGHGWITSPARSALDTACLVSQESGVAVVDWYLQTGLATLYDLLQTHARMVDWPGSLGLHRVLALVDGKAESVGETRVRLMCRAHGLPAPTPQFEVRHPSGRLAGRVDFAWPELGLLLEFDGMVKYHRYRRAGETIEQMVIREKQREDLLRELTGWTVIRITWADLAHPEATVARILRAMKLAA
ncbi:MULTISPECIES: type IV toxin-antitoxin system AbiEi family antitoxin domain-containing protein [unclassified Nocardioides]|uniref:type IV toxin-antitoxin system AbiEi family antitoxin domain-containing protein n=1 Tax=unclassified Nocardioides TaxID=2615069 RepID=UPI000B2216E8|nr:MULTISPECIES: type IV toxin-antitoxin system AbiEi family antitoxin domain-containing protein [unclassified Nocardioides]